MSRCFFFLFQPHGLDWGGGGGGGGGGYLTWPVYVYESPLSINRVYNFIRAYPNQNLIFIKEFPTERVFCVIFVSLFKNPQPFKVLTVFVYVLYISLVI